MERTGTTVTSELIMSTAGALGPFETGFLAAERPALFNNVHPFFEHARRGRAQTLRGGLQLDDAQLAELLESRTHADMYHYALATSPLFRRRGANTTIFVDKAPRYARFLSDAMRRAPPGTRFVVVSKTVENGRRSWEARGNAHLYEKTYANFRRQVELATRDHPGLVYELSYENLFLDLCTRNETARRLFDFLGLPFEYAWFSGRALKRKRKDRCQLCRWRIAPATIPCDASRARPA